VYGGRAPYGDLGLSRTQVKLDVIVGVELLST
jgi:hypothetical protein